MVLADFKSVVSFREIREVGSIPTRPRGFFIEKLKFWNSFILKNTTFPVLEKAGQGGVYLFHNIIERVRLACKGSLILS